MSEATQSSLITDLMELLRSFWNQDQNWQAAEADLQARTAERARHVSAADQALANSAKPEVLCWRAVMSDDLPRAIDLAQQVTDTLIGGEELRPYRALCSAWLRLGLGSSRAQNPRAGRPALARYNEKRSGAPVPSAGPLDGSPSLLMALRPRIGHGTPSARPR
jgi:hypothetical protein